MRLGREVGCNGKTRIPQSLFWTYFLSGIGNWLGDGTFGWMGTDPWSGHIDKPYYIENVSRSDSNEHDHTPSTRLPILPLIVLC